MIPQIISEMTRHLPTTPVLCQVTVVPVKNSLPKQCFNNASKYVKKYNAQYCLGYYLYEGKIPIEHAWVSTDIGFLEITLETQAVSDEYYLFFQLSKEELAMLEKKHGYAPSIYEYVKQVKHDQSR